MRLIDADEAIRAVHDEFDECLVWDESGATTANEFENIILQVPTVDIDAITESHERIGYDRGFRDGYAEALKETDNVPDTNVGKRWKMRLIDADALKELIANNVYPVQDAFNDRDYGMFWTGGIEKAIDNAPTVDPVKRVKHGEWRYDEALELEWCSECGFGKRKGDKRWYSYCPNCGAYMGVVKHETD
jgi:hypothetical protein